MSIFVAPRKAVVEKASPVGPGSGVLITEFSLDAYGGVQRSPQKRMREAWNLAKKVPWIALAEDAIGERFSGVAWHLEDETDAEIDDTTTNADARAALLLIEQPARDLKAGAPFYRSDLWALTSRAMGVCGSAFILLDQLEALAGTPSAMLPIAPWRLTPQEDPAGNLIGWWVDKTKQDDGIPVKLDEILHFPLRRNFEGHFGTGNVETAMLKLQNSTGLDQHLSLVLSAGGRISGIMSPKSGTIEPETMLQMERDWRTVVEQSDAAKRLQLVRAPVDFTTTSLSPEALQLADLMTKSRDDLLTIWGVPLSIVGGTTPAGLNSGDTRKYDEAAIWQGPVHHRLGIFREVVQYQLLDRFAARGATVELELEEPEFDDDSPRYDLLGKSLNTPMTNAERRALIGLDPLGDPALDDAIILPATIVAYAQAPAEDGTAVPTTVSAGLPGGQTQQTPAAAAAGETSDPAAIAKKATIHPRLAPLRTSLIALRGNLQARYTPKLRAAVGRFLDDQKHEIAAALRKHADHLAQKPGDHSVWWDGAKWDAKLAASLTGPLTGVAESVSGHIGGTLAPAKAGPPGAVERVIRRGAARVTKINETTRDAIDSIIATTIEQGGSILDAADALETLGAFDDYRSELIARTELMDAYNGAALGSYSDAGLSQVQAIDGDGDPECAERDGQVFDIDEADTIEDHPNGTLDWVPVIGDYIGQDIQAAYDAGDYATGQALNIEAGIARGGSVESGGAMKAPLTTTLEGLQAVIRNLGQPPIVNMPEQKPPVVHIAPPVVNVEAQPAPIVNVPPLDMTPFIAAIENLKASLAPKPVTRTVHRDAEGRITSVTES